MGPEGVSMLLGWAYRLTGSAHTVGAPAAGLCWAESMPPVIRGGSAVWCAGSPPPKPLLFLPSSQPLPSPVHTGGRTLLSPEH